MTVIEKINNLPEYAKEYKYIVAREVDGEFWFWGAYGYYEQACKAVREIHGIIIRGETL